MCYEAIMEVEQEWNKCTPVIAPKEKEKEVMSEELESTTRNNKEKSNENDVT